ncbi:tetratricopeptide repeat protein [Arenimonas oryziterrae]|uniref:Cardiolipin synthase N-terminal domain-containing protein n=1 Tax=Arenimonas oryziterrae DSM 21050 = YC6267 TaxID=1121015 RepID=A0A091ATD4_9GAMM|nr:tetratricopeptide repeat protein [Arenimonas oryziterrae]KFN42274.1 hypothetical protein N789_14415 [Arenimonas oryziterrae DSM 21050 = YC6267]
MPIAGLGLHIIIAIFFATHAIRSGQDRYWLWILFMFPGLGSLVYALTIWLPDARHSRQGQQVVRGVRRILDPSRELREAQEQLDIAATPEHRLRLADALLGAGRASESVVQFQAVLSGIYAKDAAITVRYAEALLEAGKAGEARTTLETLISEQPGFKSSDGHLIYARALAALDERVKAREEFEVLVGYFGGLEARARYAGVLQAWGDRERARALLDESLTLAKRMPGYARDLNKPWLAELKRLDGVLRAA